MIFRAYILSSGVKAEVSSIVGYENIVEVWKMPRFISRTTWKDWVRTAAAALKIEMKMAGSNGHASGLNAACASTKPDVIDILADADTVMLKSGWDNWLRGLMKEKAFAGTTYEGIDGFSSGGGKVQTYKDLPNVTWLAVGPGVDFSSFRCDAAKEKRVKIENREMSELYNLPVGSELIRDVGWKLPMFIRDHKLAYAAFFQAKPTQKEAIAVKSGNDYNEEYQWEGRPVVAHQRGSHQHAFRNSDISCAFYNAVEDYLNDLKD